MLNVARRQRELRAPRGWRRKLAHPTPDERAFQHGAQDGVALRVQLAGALGPREPFERRHHWRFVSRSSSARLRSTPQR